MYTREAIQEMCIERGYIINKITESEIEYFDRSMNKCTIPIFKEVKLNDSKETT